MRRAVHIVLLRVLGGALAWAAIGRASGGAPSADELAREATRCREILRRSIVRLYLPACVDPTNGGYFESLVDGRFAPAGEKFLTLQGRQLWFFSVLAEEGIERDAALRAARAGYEFLQQRMLDRDHGGYFAKVTDDGQRKDPRKHAYLNAFALYGLVAWHRASGDPAALQAAQNLFSVFESHMHDDRHGGYHEFFHADWRPVTDRIESGYVGAIGTKTYNTHLHLLESFAALYRAWPDERVRRRLAELLYINTTTVAHPQWRCNIDGWHPEWRMVDEPRNLRASYGHDVECVWLALDAARALGLSDALLRNWAQALWSYDLEFGYDARHGGFFYTGPLGKQADDRRKEWWVQAEALVSALEMYRLTGDAKYYDVFRQTLDFVEKYQVAAEGSWWATRAEDGAPAANRSRTSMWQGAYHNGRAMILCARLLEHLPPTKD